MCITGHEGQGFLGEDLVLIPAGKQQAFQGNWAGQSNNLEVFQTERTWGPPTGLQTVKIIASPL